MKVLLLFCFGCFISTPPDIFSIVSRFSSNANSAREEYAKSYGKILSLYSDAYELRSALNSFSSCRQLLSDGCYYTNLCLAESLLGSHSHVAVSNVLAAQSECLGNEEDHVLVTYIQLLLSYPRSPSEHIRTVAVDILSISQFQCIPPSTVHCVFLTVCFLRRNQRASDDQVSCQGNLKLFQDAHALAASRFESTEAYCAFAQHSMNEARVKYQNACIADVFRFLNFFASRFM
jgi:hypothetical protein